MPAFDTERFSERAAALFQAEQITGPESPLTELAGNVLLFFQALSIIAVVAAVVWKIQKERTQLEGLATALLTVAFIATVPLWSEQVLGAAQVVASSIGFQAATEHAAGPTPIIADLWRLVEQWVPPGSPYLDVLETQAASRPASGTEPEWALRAWNWARGVGTADASLLHGMWQAGSGGLRAGIVFGTCALAVCASSLIIALTYLAEIVRQVLLCGGFALLPIFIAGFALEAMRGQALRYVFGLASIAFWPVGWALANTVSHLLIDGTVSWMQSVSTAALGLSAGVTPPALATAAPFVAWGALFLLFALSLGICGWMLFTVVYIPILMSRAAAAGVGFLSGQVAASATLTASPVLIRTGGVAPPSATDSPRTLVVPRAVFAPAFSARSVAHRVPPDPATIVLPGSRLFAPPPAPARHDGQRSARAG